VATCRPNAHSVIANARRGFVAISLYRDLDMTFRRSVFGGIVDEIGEYLNKTHRIAIDNERLVAQRDADLVSPRLYQRSLVSRACWITARDRHVSS